MNLVDSVLNKCSLSIRGWNWLAYAGELFPTVLGFSWQRFIHYFLATFFFIMTQLLLIIGRTLLNFMDFNLNYCWQHERSWQRWLWIKKVILFWNKIWSYHLPVMVFGSCSPCWRRSEGTGSAFACKWWATVSSQ